MNRPSKEIDIEELEELCQLAPTTSEIAAFFGLDGETIDCRMQEAKYRKARESGISKGNLSLRRAQLKAALDGDRTMLIWLGKQRLGQKDEKTLKAEVEQHVEHVVGLEETLALVEEAVRDTPNAVAMTGSNGIAK